jgi:hypothetical protein
MKNGKVEKKRIRYASWGSDKTYRWKWRATLQDYIFKVKLYVCR